MLNATKRKKGKQGVGHGDQLVASQGDRANFFVEKLEEFCVDHPPSIEQMFVKINQGDVLLTPGAPAPLGERARTIDERPG